MIIILNLLISIISNSFAEIKIREKVANNYEKTVLLKEIDESIPWFLIHFFERSQKLQKYLIIIKCISDDNRIIRRSNEEIYDKLNEISTLFSLQIEKNKIKHQEEN